jgi:hypothetical protein
MTIHANSAVRDPSNGQVPVLKGSTLGVTLMPRLMMKPHPTTTGNYEVARAAAEKGIAAVPILPGSKVPAVKWKPFQSELPPDELLREWFLSATRYNIAIVCSGMVLFDCDAPEKADLVLRHCGETPHKLKTPRGGVHLGYRKRKGVRVQNQVQIKGQPIDIRTDGGLEVIPFSETEHGRYEWLGSGLHRIADLPVAKVGWTRERPKKRPRVTPLHLEGLGESRSHIRFPTALAPSRPGPSGRYSTRLTGTTG